MHIAILNYRTKRKRFRIYICSPEPYVGITNNERGNNDHESGSRYQDESTSEDRATVRSEAHTEMLAIVCTTGASVDLHFGIQVLSDVRSDDCI